VEADPNEEVRDESVFADPGLIGRAGEGVRIFDSAVTTAVVVSSKGYHVRG